jgi:hypothetical protein
LGGGCSAVNIFWSSYILTEISPDFSGMPENHTIPPTLLPSLCAHLLPLIRCSHFLPACSRCVSAVHSASHLLLHGSSALLAGSSLGWRSVSRPLSSHTDTSMLPSTCVNSLSLCVLSHTLSLSLSLSLTHRTLYNPTGSPELAQPGLTFRTDVSH